MNIHKKTKKGVALVTALCLLLISFFAVSATAEGYETGKYTTYEAMNFRAGPSTDYEILLVIPEYTTVEVTEVSGSFGKLTYNGVTGWMNLDYSTYISEKPVEPVDPPKEHGDAWLVADISIWNGTIDWNNLRRDGIEGVILRIGGRGYGSAKAMYADTAFPTYYKRAKAAGLHVGVYFFSYAMNAAMAREEADYTVSILQENECELDMPVFIDMEDADYDSQHYDAGRAVCSNVVDTFCSVVEQAGYYAGVYTGKWFAEELIDPAVFANRAVWIAHYNVDECGYKDYPVDMWQYTATGRIASIDGYVDLNKCYVDFPAIINERQNGGEPETPYDFGEHVPEDEWTVLREVSCTQPGLRAKLCKDCGITLLQETVPQRNHEESEEALLLLSYLHKPGDVLTPEEIVRLHPRSDPNYELIYEPGYQITGGIKLTYCTSCKKILTAEYSIPLCTHNSPKETQTAPTCVNDGYRLKTCTVCGSNISGALLPATKHEKGELSSTYASCERGGATTANCTVCGEELYWQFLPPLAHQFVLKETVTQATLTAGGEEIYVCSACGKEEQRFPGPLLLADITNDGEITAEDARIALRVSVLLEEATPSGAIAGDTDNDGVITAADARNILRVAVGLTTPEQLKATYYGMT